MTAPERTVLLSRLDAAVMAFRDLADDLPLHVATEADEHAEAIREAARELRRVTQ